MWIQNWFQKDKNKERIGQILFSKESVPLFHETPPITNKKIYIVKKNVDKDSVEAIELGLISSKDVVLYLPNRVLTQNGVPVKVKNAQLKPLFSDDAFIKEGFQKGQIYLFTHLGYLNDLNSDKKVELVTDQLVIFKEIGGDFFSCYTYQELNALQTIGKLQIA